MNLNILLITLVVSFATRVFSSKLLTEEQDRESVPVSRTRRHEYFDAKADPFSVHKHLNSLDLGDTEPEYDGEAAKVQDRFTFSLQGMRGDSKEYTSDLNEELFKAALGAVNLERLRVLVAKRKHKLLTPEQKASIFKRAFYLCKYEEDKNKLAVFGEIFEILLQAQFYPSEGFASGMVDLRNHFYNVTEEEKYPLVNILQDQLLYRPFLDYDQRIFSREKKVNYVIQLIGRLEYTLAKTALLLGFDPTIFEVTGRNALDFALDDPDYPPTSDQEHDRQDVIRILQEDFGMDPSNTIENLDHICRREKNSERAVNLIRLGGMKFSFYSPIGEALFYLANADLVNAAIDTYSDDLPVSQILMDLSLYSLSFIEDENQRGLLEEAAERVRTLKNIV